MKEIKVGVAGNPNSGKSTLINAIAGTHLRVGNWPGVTVEKKTATLEYKGLIINLVDLPGTYSLSPYSLEEKIARDFLIKEKPDIVIDIIDSTNLERNLYLTLQLLELEIPVILVLNMWDEVEKKGYKIHTDLLESILGIKVVPTVATKKKGIDKLLEVIKEYSENLEAWKPKRISYGSEIEEAIYKIIENLKNSSYKSLLKIYPARWLALKLLEKDSLLLEETGLKDYEDPAQEIRKNILKDISEDLESHLADIRYGIAHGITKQVLERPSKAGADLTEKIDKILLNRFFGLIVFVIMMWFVFKITFDFSTPYCDWLDEFFSGPVTQLAIAGLKEINAPQWIISLVTDGIIGGVGAVLTFTPLIAVILFLLTFLEGTGYMARAAFLMDRIMHALGLHGKSFIPLILGFGCNVPCIYATRILENETDRQLTAIIAPLITCGARLPVYVAFIGAFFALHSAVTLLSIYLLSIIMTCILGIILRKTIYKGETPVFIMELPPYRIPTFKDLMIHTWLKLKHFLIKAGTFILAMSVIIWFLLNFPQGSTPENSYMGKISNAISPIFKPLGFGNWESASALITGIIAKELVIDTMAQIYISEAEESEEKIQLAESFKNSLLSLFSAVKDSVVNVITHPEITSVTPEEAEKSIIAGLRKTFNPLTAYAFMVFVLIYFPCIVTGIAMKLEFGSWKPFIIAALSEFTLAWITAFIIYQGGKLLGLGA